MSILILNGRASAPKPNELLVVNKHHRFEPPVINGLMPTDISINGLDRMPILNGCVLNLPLYHPILSPSTFKSLDAYQHSCTVTGALWTPQGRTLAGAGNIVVPDVFADIGTSNMAFGAWFKLTTWASNRSLVGSSVSDGGGISGFTLMWRTPNLMRLRWGQNDVILSSGLSTATWYHLFFVRTAVTGAGSVAFYLNGVEDATGNANGASLSTSGTFRLGSNGFTTAGWFFDGVIGEAWAYIRAPSAAEIKHIYQATRWRYL